MEITIDLDVRLCKEQVLVLLSYFDNSSDHPLHEGLDFDSYSEKLSKFAYFVIASDDSSRLGFIAYYLNEDGRFVYIPQIVVHKDGRHKGIGHKMLQALKERYSDSFANIRLEVLKDNMNAKKFYEREGFTFEEDRAERLLLACKIK